MPQVTTSDIAQNAISNTRLIAGSVIRNWQNYDGFIRAIRPRRDMFQANVNGRNMRLGDTTFLRLPNSYSVGSGPDISQTLNAIQNVLVPFPISVHQHCALEVSNVEKTLNIEDDPRKEEWLVQTVDPMMKNLVATVAQRFATNLTCGISSVYVTKDADGNIAPPGLNEWAQATAALERLGVPGYAYKVGISPETSATSAVAMAQLYNPQMTIGDQTTKGRMTSPIGGVTEWHRDIYIPLLTTGTYTSGATATGSVTPYIQSSNNSMSGFNTYYSNFGASVLSVQGFSGTLSRGDFITIDGVYECNRLTGKSTGFLKVFTVIEDVPSGSTSIPVSPSIIAPQTSGVFTPFQTVTASPASGAAITPVLPPDVNYRRNVMFLDDTFYLAFVEMSLETPGAYSARVNGDADDNYFSAVASYQFNNLTYFTTLRCDILGGFTVPFSDRGIIVPHIISRNSSTSPTAKMFKVPEGIDKLKS